MAPKPRSSRHCAAAAWGRLRYEHLSLWSFAMIPPLWVLFSGANRRRQDVEFMPELQGAILEDTPWAARLTVWLTGLLLVVALVWAKYAVIDEVTTGEGKAIASSKVQT